MRDLCAASSHFIFKSRIKRKEEGKKKGHGSTRRICIHQSSTWARDEALSLGLNKLLEGKGNKKKGKLSDKKPWPFLWLDGGSSVCSGTSDRPFWWTSKKYLRWMEDVGVYPNTGSQASMFTSKGGDSFLPFAKQVTEVLKNPGTGRWATSAANTTAK